MKLLGGFRKDVCSFLVGKDLGEEWFGPIIQVRLTLRYLQTGKWIMRFYIPTSTECGESNGTQLQHSCLKNPMDGGAWWAAVHGVAKSRTQLSDFPFFFFFYFPFTFHFPALEKEMATHSNVLVWRIPGTGSLVGCRLWGRTELDTTEAT